MKNILLAAKINQLKNNPSTKVLATDEQNKIKGGEETNTTTTTYRIRPRRI